MKISLQILLLAALAGWIAQAAGASPGMQFSPLFDGESLNGWTIENNGRFSVREGVLLVDQGTGWLRSDREFGDFKLVMEFRFLEEGANSGVFVRTAASSHEDENGWPDNGYQIQCMDTLEGDYPLGALIPYGAEVESFQSDPAALRRAYRPAGNWHRYEIVCSGGSMTVKLNGALVTTVIGMEKRAGHVGIQGENGLLEFRRIDIHEFPRESLPGAVPRSVLDLALEPALINTSPGPEYSSRELDYAMVIGMDRSPGGRLWAAWVAGGDNDKGLFVVATSDDGGDHWSEPVLVIDPADSPCGLRRRALVGNFWTDPTGRLWLFFDQSMGYFDGRAGSWAITCDNPDAAVPVWSAPRRIWHGATLCKPLVLDNGEWLLPISLWTRDWLRPEVLEGAFPELDRLRKAHVFVSADQGATWSWRGAAAARQRRFDEHMFVQLEDGRLWMLVRTYYGIAESFSNDRGRTWTDPVPSRFQHVERGARIFFRRLQSGNLLLVKHGKLDEQTEKRSHLTAFLSADDGRTWSRGLLLDERAGVSYPDGFESPEGLIHVIYDRNRSTDSEILMARFTEADILAGQFATAQSRARILVHKALGNKPQH
jgi:hypothetical protein